MSGGLPIYAFVEVVTHKFLRKVTDRGKSFAERIVALQIWDFGQFLRGKRFPINSPCLVEIAGHGL